MRKTSILLSMLALFAMVLAACGGGATSTNVVSSPPPVTADATDDMPATEMPTEVGTATEEPGVPVTGDVNPARVSNQLDFPVLSQDGEQIGEVDDMVLDLDNRSVAYVVVSTGGFLDIGDKTIAVPWDSLTLQTDNAGTGGAVSTPSDDATAAPEATATGAATTATTEPAATAEGAATADAGQGAGMTQENAFILQIDQETFNNAPEFDLNTLPQMGQSAGDWDANISSYWEGGAAGDAASTPSGDATAAPEVTATGEATTATAEPAATAEGAATADAGQGAGQGQALQGVVLASEVLGSTITLGAGLGTDGTGTGQVTAVPGTDGGDTATATPGTGTDQATATADAGAMDQGNLSATIADLIVDTDAGDIMYIVVNTTFDDGEHWIPVPLGMFQWNADTGGFMLNAEGAMLQNAPFFQDGEFPDTSLSGWNSEFDSFWQGNGAADATATP